MENALPYRVILCNGSLTTYRMLELDCFYFRKGLKVSKNAFVVILEPVRIVLAAYA